MSTLALNKTTWSNPVIQTRDVKGSQYHQKYDFFLVSIIMFQTCKAAAAV